MAKKTNAAEEAVTKEQGTDVASSATENASAVAAENVALKRELAEATERVKLLEKFAPKNLKPITKVDGLNVRVKHGVNHNGVNYTREDVAKNEPLIRELLKAGSSAVEKVSA